MQPPEHSADLIALEEYCFAFCAIKLAGINGESEQIGNLGMRPCGEVQEAPEFTLSPARRPFSDVRRDGDRSPANPGPQTKSLL